jgi:hypothetical protein
VSQLLHTLSYPPIFGGDAEHDFVARRVPGNYLQELPKSLVRNVGAQPEVANSLDRKG